jgi:hypothetical protein
MGGAKAGRFIALTAAVAAGMAGACGSAMLRPDGGGGTGGSTAGSGGGRGGATSGTGGATAGTGGATGGAGGATGGATAGTGGAIGGTGGGAGAGTAGTGGSGTGGTAPMFVGGPCAVTPDLTAVEVFARSSEGRLLRRAYDGSNWGSWANLPALSGSMIDARSDLDCSSAGGTVHLVATGLNPVGALLHAFGSGTTYNPFVRELASLSVAPGPSIAVASDIQYFLGALGIGATFPVLYEIGTDTASPREITPITTQTDSFRSGPDIAIQPAGGSGLRYFAAFDTAGVLAINYNVINSGGASWAQPVKLSPPLGTFSFSPAICTENGGFGVSSVNVVAVAGGRLWYARTSSITSPFSSWTMIAMEAASSPDCVVAGGPGSIVHVVTLSAAGTVLDINGKGTSWVATDLGSPP